MMVHPTLMAMCIWVRQWRFIGCDIGKLSVDVNITGHALNKILKDIVNRYKMIQGHKVW